MKKYVERYLLILERNEESIFKRLMSLTEDHIDRIEDIDPDMMTNE